jgi:hypothetical protein
VQLGQVRSTATRSNDRKNLILMPAATRTRLKSSGTKAALRAASGGAGGHYCDKYGTKLQQRVCVAHFLNSQGFLGQLSNSKRQRGAAGEAPRPESCERLRAAVRTLCPVLAARCAVRGTRPAPKMCTCFRYEFNGANRCPAAGVQLPLLSCGLPLRLKSDKWRRLHDSAVRGLLKRAAKTRALFSAQARASTSCESSSLLGL